MRKKEWHRNGEINKGVDYSGERDEDVFREVREAEAKKNKMRRARVGD